MRNPDVDAIFVDCLDGCHGCIEGCYSFLHKCTGKSVLIHTDFFVVRPALLRPGSFSLKTFAMFSNAEETATHAFEHIIQSGRYRWLSGTKQAKGNCRVVGQNSPVLHQHDVNISVRCVF